MNPVSPVGFFGKLLSRGDFVSRGLPPTLVQQWDSWLQQSVASSQHQLGEHWRAVYLTSPIWHFLLRPGCLDTLGWAGLLMPSLDRVGRYYPLLIAAPLRGPIASLEVCRQAWLNWHCDAEQLARQSLQGQLSPEQLEERLHTHQCPEVSLASSLGSLPSAELRVPRDQPLAAATLAATTSLWWTTGSPQVAPSQLLCHGLPAPEQFQALLTGDWQNWASI